MNRKPNPKPSSDMLLINAIRDVLGLAPITQGRKVRK